MDKEAKNGDKESFVSALPNALEALCVQGAPQDDTILHRLLDIIKEQITSSDDSCRSGLFNFLETVKEKINDLNSAVLVLALGVAAHLGSLPLPDNLRQRLMSVYDVVQSSNAVKNSSVGAAYYNSLTSVAGHAVGLAWLEENNIHVQAALSTIETAHSVFLLNAAENFVITCLTNRLEECSTVEQMPVSPSSVTVVDTVQFLAKELAEMMKERASVLDHMIVSSHVSAFRQSVARITSTLSQSKAFCKWKAEDAQFITTLAHLACLHSSEKIQLSALQCIVNLVGFMKDKSKEEFLSKEIIAPILKLVADGATERAIVIAAAFIPLGQDGTASSAALTKLQKFYQLPHDVMFGQQSHPEEFTGLRSSVTSMLCDRQRFSRLISSLMYSVKQTDNREGLVRLVQTASTTKDDEDWVSQQSSWPQGMGGVIMNNQKLLNSLLHVLQQDDCLELSLQQCTTVLTSLMHIMGRPLVESRLYSQACTAFHSVLHKKYKGLDSTETAAVQEVLSRWVELMEYRLVSVQWEIRDTTLESILKVVGIVSDSWLCNVMLEHHLLRHAWNCTKYGESYPRASAISLATSLISLPHWWSAFLQDADVTETSLIDEMVEVVRNDTEAFPRRAAVVFLTTLLLPSTNTDFSQTPNSDSSDITVRRNRICSAMTSAICDHDWEVKIKVLEFWEKLATPLFSRVQNVETNGVKMINPDAKSNSTPCRKRSAQNKSKCEKSTEECLDILEALLQEGFGDAVLAGAEDYDSSVKQKALHMLHVIERQLKIDDCSSVKFQKLDRDSKETHTADMPSADKENKEASDAELSKASPSDKVSVISVNQFLCRLSQLDPSSQLKQLGTSTDEYDRKPSSLLEDVVAAVKMASSAGEVTLMSEDEFDDADDMFVDCY